MLDNGTSLFFKVVIQLILKEIVACPSKLRPTSACTRPPTALFFKGHAPAKMSVVEACLAGPVSGDARG
jgi:hypothetical protein